ncbi:MAG: hypothetical protein WBA12_02720 [Catalinimonas sp.]
MQAIRSFRWLKAALISLGVVLVILVAAWFAAARWLPPRLTAYLQETVATRTDGVYRLEIGSWHFDPLGGNFEVRNIALRGDTAHFRDLQLRVRDRGQLYDIDVPVLSLRQVNLFQALAKRQLRLAALDVLRPEVRIVIRPLEERAPPSAPVGPRHADTTAADTTYQNPLELYQYISNVLDVIEIGELRLIDGEVNVETWRDTTARLRFPHVTVTFEDLRIDSLTRYDQSRFFYAERFRAEARDYYIETPDSFYNVTARRLLLASDPGTLVIDDLAVEPRYLKEEHGRRAGQEKDRYTVKLPHVKVVGLDLKRALRLRELRAESVVMDKFDLQIFRDKRERFPHEYKPLPAEALRRLPIWVGIDTLRMQNLSISYEEIGPQSAGSGTVLFDDIEVEVTRLTNDPIALAAGAVMHVNASGRLMRASRFTSQLDFYLGDTNERFTARGELAPFALRALNPMVEPRVFMHIESGRTERLSYELEGSNLGATGRLRLPYRDLRVSLVHKETGDTTRFAQEALSFLANALVLKRNNPSNPRKEPREGHIYYVRDPEKSFFNYWWKALFSGVKDVAGVMDPRPRKNTVWEWFGIGKGEEKDN